MLVEILFIALLALIFFSIGMFEAAVLASRRSRLKELAEEGVVGSEAALKIFENPSRVITNFQIATIFVCLLAGLVSGSLISLKLVAYLEEASWARPWSVLAAHLVAFSCLFILFAILGRLIPRHLAHRNPERVACLFAKTAERICGFISPGVRLWERLENLLHILFGSRNTAEKVVPNGESELLFSEGFGGGFFKKEEKEMVEGIFYLNEQNAEDLMTPRARIVWLSVHDSDEENWRRIAGSGHSQFPVYVGTRDNVLGMVSVKALWANLSLAGSADLRALVTPPLYVREDMPASQLIGEFKRTGKHIALVVDEFGGLQGLVTLNDVMMAIVGDLPEKGHRQEPKVVRREDGSWLMDALLEIDQVKETLQIERRLPGEEDDDFSTLGGFILARLGHIPKEGESFTWDGFRFEVVDMDRQRVDKVLVTSCESDFSERDL